SGLFLCPKILYKGMVNMDKVQAVSKAQAIQALLSEYDVENDSLDTFIKEAETMPDGETIDKYNELVEEYNSSKGYNDKMDSAEDLINFYNSHPEELEMKEHEINALIKVTEDAEKLNQMYNELLSLVEE